MDTQKCRELGYELLLKHGLTDWTFQFDESIRRFGVCRYKPKITQPKQDAIMLKSGGYGAEHNFSFSELTVGAFGMKKRWSGSSAKELFVWITTKGKSRYSNRRERIEVDRYACIYKDTPEAREIAKKVLKISEKVDKFVKEKVAEQKALIADLTPIEPAIDAEKLPEWEQ